MPAASPPSSAATPASDPFIAGCMSASVDVPDGQWLVQRVSPPGGATLSFRWGGAVALLDTDPPKLPPPISFTGPITCGGTTACSGALRMFVVFFTAAGAHGLFGLEMSQFANRSVDATSLLGEWTRDVSEALACAGSDAERRSIFDAAVRCRVRPHAAVPGLGARAAALIRARSGKGAIGEIHAALGVSERTLRRRFLHEVGVPVKAYARWVRFNQTHEWLWRTPRASWTSAAHRFGYADQAHLVREYRHFAGQPPTHLQISERLYDPAFVPDVGGLPRS